LRLPTDGIKTTCVSFSSGYQAFINELWGGLPSTRLELHGHAGVQVNHAQVVPRLQLENNLAEPVLDQAIWQ
jgi:hypothetical protein